MSRPQTDAEWDEFRATEAAAGPAENVVSTACPECGQRFAMVAAWRRGPDEVPRWELRCTRCGCQRIGELK